MRVKQKTSDAINALVTPENPRGIEVVILKQSRKGLAKTAAKSVAFTAGLNLLTLPFGFVSSGVLKPRPSYLVITDTRLVLLEVETRPTRDHVLFVAPLSDVKLEFSGMAFSRIAIRDKATNEPIAVLRFTVRRLAFNRARAVIESSPHYRRLPPPPQSPAPQPNGAGRGHSDQYQYPPQAQYPQQEPQYQYQYDQPSGWDDQQTPQYGYQLPPEWSTDDSGQPRY